MKSMVAAALLLSTPAFAGLSSRPAADESPAGAPMEGLYAGISAGGALIILDFGNTFGYDFEGRLGYSFNPGLQIFLSGAVDGGTIIGSPFRSEIIAAFVQYHLYARPRLGVYARAGIGAALSSTVPTSSGFNGSAVGLATAGGLGVEIAIGPGLFLTPELFYKNASLSLNNGGGSTTEQVLGLQLALIFY